MSRVSARHVARQLGRIGRTAGLVTLIDPYALIGLPLSVGLLAHGVYRIWSGDVGLGATLLESVAVGALLVALAAFAIGSLLHLAAATCDAWRSGAPQE